MPGTTPVTLIPFYIPGDNLSTLDDTSYELANRLHLLLPRSGQVIAPITAAGTPVDVFVAFPADRFPVGSTIAVTATPVAGTIGIHSWTIVSADHTGFTLRAQRSSGSTNVTYNWTAQRVNA